MNVVSGSDFKVPFHRGGKPVLRETLQIEGTRQHAKKRENGRRRRDRSSINFLEPGGPGTSFSARHHQERRIPFVSLRLSLSLCAHRYCQHYTRWNILSLGFRFYLFLSFPLSFFSHLSHRRDFENLSLPPLIDEQFEVFFSLSLSLYLVTKGGKNKPVSFMKILSLESRYSRQRPVTSRAWRFDVKHDGHVSE